MSKNLNRAAAARGRGKKSRKSLLWIGLSSVVIITLLVTEQVALLYILSTLAVCALLVVVAFADLRGARRETPQAAPRDDSASIGDRTAGAATSTTFGSTAARAVRDRQSR